MRFLLTKTPHISGTSPIIIQHPGKGCYHSRNVHARHQPEPTQRTLQGRAESRDAIPREGPRLRACVELSQRKALRKHLMFCRKRTTSRQAGTEAGESDKGHIYHALPNPTRESVSLTTRPPSNSTQATSSETAVPKLEERIRVISSARWRSRCTDHAEHCKNMCASDSPFGRGLKQQGHTSKKKNQSSPPLPPYVQSSVHRRGLQSNRPDHCRDAGSPTCPCGMLPEALGFFKTDTHILLRALRPAAVPGKQV